MPTNDLFEDKKEEVVPELPQPVVVPEPTPQPEVVVEEKSSIVNYNTSGEATTKDTDTIVAKAIVSTKLGDVFKLAVYKSAVYNPSGPFSNREKFIREDFKYVEVPKEIFNKYFEFLYTKNLNTYHFINRKVLNG
jgi:hypothetical protein